MTRLDRFRDIFLAWHAKPSGVAKSTGNQDRVRITRSCEVFSVCMYMCTCVYKHKRLKGFQELLGARLREFSIKRLVCQIEH